MHNSKNIINRSIALIGVVMNNNIIKSITIADNPLLCPIYFLF